MSSRLFHIILILMVIIGLWGTARVQTRMDTVAQELRTRVEQEFGRVSDWSYQVDQHLLRYKDRLDDLTRTPDLSVLDSCGIITDGLGYGSCVAIDSDLILTAGHCLEFEGSWVEIGGVRYEIAEKWADDIYDVGFVRIKGILPYVELGSMPKLLDVVYLVGAPYNKVLVNTITKGIISHLDRDIPIGIDLIQTDAEGAPGSSGGPLLNTSGHIIGIYTALIQPGGGVALCVSVVDIQLALEEYNATFAQ